MNIGNLPLFFYVVSMAFALLYGGFRRRGLYVFSLCAAWLGFIVQTIIGALSWIATGIPPATNLHELLQVVAWAVMALYLALYPHLRSRRILPFFLMPLVTFIYLLGSLVLNVVPKTKPFFYTPWFVIHIFLLVFGIASFFVSFLYAAIFIMQDHSLRHRHKPTSLPIPSLEEAEKWTTRLLLAGYPTFTLGILSAAAYGILHGAKNGWRPGVMEYSSVVAWIVLGLAIYGWVTAKVHPRRRSWFVVVGAAFSFLILIGIIWH